MASVVAAEAQAGTRFSVGYRRWLLGLLLAVYACSFIDRTILSTVGQAIKVDLKLTDAAFGLLTGPAFALFYTVLGVPIGRMAERFNRVSIISVCIALWSIMTMLSGTAAGYVQLLLYRMGVGVGEGGCSPAAHSLLSDHYPAKQRGGALAIYFAGVPLGIMIGAIAGGWLTQTFNWRTAFLVVGAPGLLLAVLVRLTLREPPRGQADGKAPAPEAPPMSTVIRRLFSTPTFCNAAAGCVLTNLASSGIAQFAASYFVRGWGLNFTTVGLLYGLVTGAAGTVGMLAGGFVTDAAGQRDARWRMWLPAIGSALALPLFATAYTRSDPYLAAGFILFGGVCYSLYFAPTFALAQNLVEPRMRGTASALMYLLINVFGGGLGPWVLGIVSDALAQGGFSLGHFATMCPGGVAPHGAAAALAQACRTASATGLQHAILICTLFYGWGAIHFLLASRTIRRDLAPAA
jgi:predicted MFS family arabinose efflux permease